MQNYALIRAKLCKINNAITWYYAKLCRLKKGYMGAKKLKNTKGLQLFSFKEIMRLCDAHKLGVSIHEETAV